VSDMSETIERLEQWAEHWAPHYPEEFIADLRALLATAKAAQRAAELLQNAQRYGLEPVGQYLGESMMSNDYGDWLEFDYVAKVIQILQEPTP
jgi:hypothetical protein